MYVKNRTLDTGNDIRDLNYKPTCLCTNTTQLISPDVQKNFLKIIRAIQSSNEVKTPQLTKACTLTTVKVGILLHILVVFTIQTNFVTTITHYKILFK